MKTPHEFKNVLQELVENSKAEFPFAFAQPQENVATARWWLDKGVLMCGLTSQTLDLHDPNSIKGLEAIYDRCVRSVSCEDCVLLHPSHTSISKSGG